MSETNETNETNVNATNKTNFKKLKLEEFQEILRRNDGLSKNSLCQKCKRRKSLDGKSRCQICFDLEKEEEQKRKEKRECRCGNPLSPNDISSCKICKKKREKNRRELRKQAALEVGLCIKCTKVEAYILGGFCICCKFKEAVKSAKTRSLKWELTLDQYISEIQKPCYYCELSNPLTKTGIDLDRLNNKKGYTLTNAVSSCYFCNMTRNNIYTFWDFKKFIAPAIKEFRLMMRDERGIREGDYARLKGGDPDFNYEINMDGIISKIDMVYDQQLRHKKLKEEDDKQILKEAVKYQALLEKQKLQKELAKKKYQEKQKALRDSISGDNVGGTKI